MAKHSQSINIFLILLLMILVWLPIPLGSNRPWSWSLMQVLMMGLACLWLVHFLRRPKPLPAALKSARIPLIFLVLWLVYFIFQITPLPVSLVKILSPATYQLYSYTYSEQIPAWISLSIDPGSTFEAGLRACSYITCFLLVLVLVDSVSKLQLLLAVILFSGVAQSLYGLVNHFAAGEFNFVADKKIYEQSYAIGTYMNRNHLAGLLEMSIGVGLGLCIAGMQERQPFFSWRAKLRAWLDFMMSAQGRRYFYIAIMFAVLFVNASRGGNIAIFAAIILTLTLAFLFKDRSAKERRLIPLMLGIMFVAFVWLGSDSEINKRLGQQGLENNRIQLWQASIELYKNYPIFGIGAGNYRWLFPLYKDEQFAAKLYDHAHNDYIEILIEQGILGAGLLFIAIISILTMIIKAYLQRKSGKMSALLFGIIVGIIALLLHGIVDFNFHIPANAMYFYSLLAAGIVATTFKRQTQVHKRVVVGLEKMKPMSFPES